MLASQENLTGEFHTSLIIRQGLRCGILTLFWGGKGAFSLKYQRRGEYK